MKNTIRLFVLSILFGCFSASCDSYLDVVPDNIATIDHAFTNRYQAEKFLFTLYSYLPRMGHGAVEGRFDDYTWTGNGPANLQNFYPYFLLRDGNNVSSPFCNGWHGYQGGIPTFIAIRKCNVLFEKIDQVKDLQPIEKNRWIAEAKFLKAYYHFLLLQQYGPIPIIDVNLPISAENEEAMVERLPVEVVFDYIIGLIDEAMPYLPNKIDDISVEMGRVTQAAALAVKAKVAVTAASPLFNGNATYASFKNRHGQRLMGEYNREKWAKAVEACKQAIDSCHHAGFGLYEYLPESTMSDETQKIVQVSRVFNDKWNKEHVWSMVWATQSIDYWTAPILHIDHSNYGRGYINPTMKAVEQFYSKNGVPIEEDKFFDYERRYETVLTTVADNKFVQPGVLTAQLHLNREYRFYGSIAFDGGWWYGLGRYNENDQWPVNAKSGDIAGQRGPERYSCTSYFIKKLINILSSFSGNTYVFVRSDYPLLRMADLYLLYAEALNEYYDKPGDDPDGDVWHYVNLVRERAGLETVQDAWINYAKDTEKYTTQSGMRDIIRRERNIELMFEGYRLFDVRRWDIATSELDGPVRGWNYLGSTPEEFYQIITVDNVEFTDRDVLSPIPTSELIRNRNLIQNPGW